MFIIHYNIFNVFSIGYNYSPKIFNRNIRKNYKTQISLVNISLYFRYLLIKAKKQPSGKGTKRKYSAMEGKLAKKSKK